MAPKVQAILSYIGILWLVAYIAGKNERNSFSKYHLKQGFGLLIVSAIWSIMAFVISSIVPSLSLMLSIPNVILLILMILGIITAANEVKKPLPVIGKLFEHKFSFID